MEHDPLMIWLHIHVLFIPLGDHLGEEGDAGVELAVALVVWHELEDGDEEVGEDERRHRLAVAAEAKHDGNSLMVAWTQKYKKFTASPYLYLLSGQNHIPF